MTDTWIVIPRSIIKKADLEWLFNYYPDDVMEVPFGYFSKKEAGPMEAQIKMFLLIEGIKNVGM